MAMLQGIVPWMEANASWLPVAAAVIQALAAVAAIPVAFIAAYWSAGRNARRAFELSEKREKGRRDEQIALSRLLLGLEVQNNLGELSRFRINFPTHAGDENDPEESEEAHPAGMETSSRLGSQQRFIALYLPDLSYRFWHSQQLSSLLPVAFKPAEISQINLIYSGFDRLLKIRTMFGDTAGQRDRAALPRPGEEAFEGARLALSPSELKALLSEFDTILRDVLETGNPIKGETEEKSGGKQKISPVVGGPRAELKP